MASSTKAGRPFGTKKWVPYVPDDMKPGLIENAARTEARMKKGKKKPKRA